MCLGGPPPGILLFASKISIETNEPYLLLITVRKAVGGSLSSEAM